MSRPSKHHKTGVYWLRVDVPADLQRLVGRKELRRSLGTKAPGEAKVAHATMLAEIHREWARLRAEPLPLTRREVVALAGASLYRPIAAMGGVALDAEADVVFWRGRLEEMAFLRTQPADAVLWAFEVDGLLAEHGRPRVVDPESREALAQELVRATEEAARANLRGAEGDFSPDPAAARFPDPACLRPAEAEVTLTGLLTLWKREHDAAGGSASAAETWARAIGAFRTHLGHDDAERVRPQDVTAFADFLRHDRRLSAKSINGSYLAAVGAVFTLGVAKHKLTANPAVGVKVKAARAHQTRSKGYTDDEAKVLLKAALRETDGDRRWLPFLAAYTGARIEELAQLRREDLREDGGIAFIRITPEAGSVKTGEYRDVPLHGHLVELGFPEFMARQRRAGRVFSANAGQRVARWVRKTLPELPRSVWPNHAWRHRFKTVCRETGITTKEADAVQGHADSSASGGYGEWSVRALNRVMERFPRQV